jgi:iron(III) transport system ATP-binding protein
LQQRVGITSVYVTHDQEEAMTLSDRVVIMQQGEIQQVGTPREIYAHPVNRFVAGFIGKANFLESRIVRIAENGIELDVMGRSITAPTGSASFSEGENVVLVVRPESIELEPKKPDTLIGTVLESVYLGSQIVYEIQVESNVLSVEIANPQEHKIFTRGEEVTITLKESGLHVLSLG